MVVVVVVVVVVIVVVVVVGVGGTPSPLGTTVPVASMDRACLGGGGVA